jgi:hypothetical protein
MGKLSQPILAMVAFAIVTHAFADDDRAGPKTLSAEPLVRTGKTRSGNPAVDGAIVCRSLAMVAFLAQQMTSKAAAMPNLSSVGCALLPAGTPVTVEGNDDIPIIRGETLLGITVRGVTDPAMVEFDPPPFR